ncbi:MAG: gamma-glutamyltransferase [Phycisphaerales bacterium]
MCWRKAAPSTRSRIFLARTPAFAEVPTRMLLSRETALSGRGEVRPARDALRRGRRARCGAEDAGTSHLCVIDAGNAVACEDTINTEFGSLVSPEGCGFASTTRWTTSRRFRVGRMCLGCADPDANLPAGKRPLSSMSQLDRARRARGGGVAGASGGPRIITGTMQALMNALSGMDAGAAVAEPRVHHQWMPDRLDLEADAMAGPGQRAALEALGHTLGERDAVGNVQLIKRVPGGWQAACDPRKGGRPAGM